MAALCSLNLHLINGQWRLLYKLRILSIPYFINLQILPSKEKDLFGKFRKHIQRICFYFTAKGYVYFTAKVWQITKSCETAEL